MYSKKFNNYRFSDWAISIIFILCVVFVLVTALGPKLLLNRPGQTEERATKNAETWIAKNNIDFKRKSCAPDSDGDGYGSCVVVTTTDEKIQLQCPGGFWMNFTGGTGCKEVDFNGKITTPKTNISNGTSATIKP